MDRLVWAALCALQLACDVCVDVPFIQTFQPWLPESHARLTIDSPGDKSRKGFVLETGDPEERLTLSLEALSVEGVSAELPRLDFSTLNDTQADDYLATTKAALSGTSLSLEASNPLDAWVVVRLTASSSMGFSPYSALHGLRGAP